MAGKALIVEDEADTGLLLAEILRRQGFEPTTVSEGREVVAWVRQHRPDLILLDLMLPDADGYAICEELKLDRDTNPIPIVMVTARDAHRDKIRGLLVGANHYLLKPFTMEQLNHAVAEVLAWRDDLQKNGAHGEVHFQFESDTGYLEELNHLLGALFLFSGLSQPQVRQLTMAVREIGVNAIEWGHQKQRDQIVSVIYRIDAEKIMISVKDMGPGFDPGNLPHAAQSEDPISHMMVRETLGLREGGFGILIARGLVDDLQFNETGNEVRLIKYFPSRNAAEARDPLLSGRIP